MVRRGLSVRRDRLVRMGWQVLWVHRDLKALPEQWVRQAPTVQLARPDRPDRPGRRVNAARTD